MLSWRVSQSCRGSSLDVLRRRRSLFEVERVAHSAVCVTHRNVEALIGRLATDPLLRQRFCEDPNAVLRDLQAEGYELTTVELDALATTNAEAIRAFAQSLDRRIRKANRQ